MTDPRGTAATRCRWKCVMVGIVPSSRWNLESGSSASAPVRKRMHWF